MLHRPVAAQFAFRRAAWPRRLVALGACAAIVPGLLAGCGGDGETPSTPDTLLPDLVVDSLTVLPTAPTELDTVQVGFQLANIGDVATPGRIPYGIGVDGTVLLTLQANPLGAGERSRVSLTGFPLEGGTRQITVILDPDNRIEERDEENNQAAVTVSVQQTLTLDRPVTVSSSRTDEVILFHVDIEEGAQEALNIELSGGSGDADMFVHFGERPGHYYEYECVSGAQDSNELCQMVPARAGRYHVAIHAFTPFGPSTLTASVGGKPVEAFDIDVVFLDHGTASQDDIVREAARRWESVIARGAAESDFTGQGGLPPNACFQGSPAVTDKVDDLRVWVRIAPIDGVGGGVATAGPCRMRAILFPESDTIYQETILGAILLDEADVSRMEANGLLLPVVVHEMAHVLGFGSVWERHRLLENPSLPANVGADTHFTGRLASAAFDAAGGTGYTGGAKVPVEDRSQQGSSDRHWRESVFDDELMTPFVGGGHALSLITIESLADLGYGVDVTAAESYTLPAASRPGLATRRGPVVYLGDDIARWPIVVMDRKRRVAGVRHPW